jgi:hypothetical protein
MRPRRKAKKPIKKNKSSLEEINIHIIQAENAEP